MISELLSPSASGWCCLLHRIELRPQRVLLRAGCLAVGVGGQRFDYGSVGGALVNLINSPLKGVERVVLNTGSDAGGVQRRLLQGNCVAAVEGDFVCGVDIDLVPNLQKTLQR